jgi:hypothetical protein
MKNKNLASVCGFLAIVSSSLPGDAPAVKAQSCNYYAGIAVTGQKVNLDTCSISKSSDRGTNFVYYLGDKKLASKANCNNQTWTTLTNNQVNTPKSQATKKMLDRVCNEQISSNPSTEEKTESTSGERSIAQTNDRSLNYYEDDLIRARGLSASFDQNKTYLTVNVMIENKSGRTLILGNVKQYYNDATVNSDSGESAVCLLRGINGVAVEQTNPLQFSVLKPKGRVNISVYQCGNITASATKSVGVTIPLVEYTKEKNNPFTLSLEGIPVKKISNR